MYINVGLFYSIIKKLIKVRYLKTKVDVLGDTRPEV